MLYRCLTALMVNYLSTLLNWNYTSGRLWAGSEIFLSDHGNRMVRGGQYAFGPPLTNQLQLLPKCGLKLPATVCGYCWWYTKSSNPTSKKGLSYCFCRYISVWDCFRWACKKINTNEDICIPIGRWQWTYNAYMNVVKLDVWCSKSTQWCHSVPLYFALLEFQTGLCPLMNVTIDIGPNITCSNETLCGSYMRVWQWMKCIKTVWHNSLGTYSLGTPVEVQYLAVGQQQCH